MTKAEKDLDAINAILEAIRKAEWELDTAIRRLRVIRNVGGTKPQWKFTKSGKLTRDSRAGGIDWIDQAKRGVSEVSTSRWLKSDEIDDEYVTLGT